MVWRSKHARRCTHFFCVAVGLFACCFTLYAQNPSLTTASHTPHATDSLIVYEIPYRTVTDSGVDCRWDFSHPTQPPIERYANYYRPIPTDTTFIAKHVYGTNHCYHLVADTLFLTGYETPTSSIHYILPEKQLVFPFSYGDSCHTTFFGVGEYAHRTPFTVCGSTTIHADAIGQLLLPTMTIDTVLRIHTRRCYTTTKQDTTLIAIDIYQWFSPQYRYPLLETICERTTTRIDSASVTLAFYHEPIELETQHNEDSPLRDAKQQTENTTNGVDTIFTDASFLPNPVRDVLHISYTLSRDAQIYFSTHYSDGTCFYQSVPKQQQAGDYHQTINMTSFPVGNYILYIHVDGAILSQPIIKQ